MFKYKQTMQTDPLQKKTNAEKRVKEERGSHVQLFEMANLQNQAAANYNRWFSRVSKPKYRWGPANIHEEINSFIFQYFIIYFIINFLNESTYKKACHEL